MTIHHVLHEGSCITCVLHELTMRRWAFETEFNGLEKFMVLDYEWWWNCLRFNDDSNRICRNLGKWGAVLKPRIKISLALVHLKSLILMSVFGDSRPCGSRRGKSGEFCPEGSVLNSRQICHSLHHLLPLPCQPTNSTGRSWPHMRRHSKWKETEKKKKWEKFLLHDEKTHTTI